MCVSTCKSYGINSIFMFSPIKKHFISMLLKLRIRKSTIFHYHIYIEGSNVIQFFLFIYKKNKNILLEKINMLLLNTILTDLLNDLLIVKDNHNKIEENDKCMTYFQ